MKSTYFGLLIGCASLMMACNGGEENSTTETVEGVVVDTAKFLTDLADLEARIDHSTDLPDDKDIKAAIIKYQDYAEIFPTDPKSPDYLLKASDFAYMVGEHQKSVKILEQIINKYPDYNRMESVKYNRASHLDFELRDTTAAKIAYQEFIDEYPTSPLVNDCKSRIPLIRYSLEELVEKFTTDAANNQLP